MLPGGYRALGSRSPGQPPNARRGRALLGSALFRPLDMNS